MSKLLKYIKTIHENGDMIQYKDEDSKKHYLKESFTPEEIKNTKLSNLIRKIKETGNYDQILNDLNALMSRIQGTDDTEERKAYFKAKKLYSKLVEYVNKQNSKVFKK